MPWKGRSGQGLKHHTEVLLMVGQSLARMRTSHPTRPSISPPAHPGHFPVARDLPGFLPLHPPSYMLSPFDRPPTSEGCTYVFYLYSWTERRLVSILPWALKIDSAKSNEYYLPSSRSDLNSMRGLETLLELEIPYSKCVFCISAPNNF